MSRFEDSFWNVEFCNFSGFAAIQHRMQDGKQMLKVYVDFLRQKAQAQRAYGRALLKLLTYTNYQEEIGSLKNGWDALHSQTKAVGTAHMVTASQVLAEAERMTVILECQREQRKCTEENVRKGQTNLTSYFKKALDCRKTYDHKCAEKDAIFQNEDARSNGNSKDLEKLLLKQEKIRQVVDNAQQAYKMSLKHLEEARQQWEKQTEDAYNRFQMLEEDRIDCLRNSMWLVTNLGSSVCVQEDAALESVRNTLETCCSNDDIEEFVRMKGTGNMRPQMIDTEDCSKKLPDHFLNISHISSFRMHNKPRILEELPQLFSRPLLKGSSTIGLETEGEFYESSVPWQTINSLSANEVPMIKPAANGIYESIDDMAMYSEPKIIYKVLHPYEGKTPEELSLQSNEIVRILFKESDSWWEVETEYGTRGYYPAEYLELGK